MGIFDGLIGEVFSSIGSAVIKTAGDFIIGGGSSTSQQGTLSQQPALQSKIAGTGSKTSRVPRPSTPEQAGIADIDVFYEEWFARMQKYASVTGSVSTGSPRTLGTQARRN